MKALTLSYLAAGLVLQTAALAENPNLVEVTVGIGTGINVIPFGGVYDGKINQQAWSRAVFPQGKLEIDEIAFTSSGGNMSVSYNVIVRLAVVQNMTADFATNLGSQSRVVWNGTWTGVMTGEPGDLNFNLRGKPFIWDTTQGDLLAQIEVVDSGSQTPIGFMFESPSTSMWRVYQNLSTGVPTLEANGLNTLITYKVRK